MGFTIGFTLLTIDLKDKGVLLQSLDLATSMFIVSFNGTYQLLSEKGEPSGYAPLNADGKIPNSNLPPSIEDAVLLLGCWDALTNNPMLQSGVGKDFEQYVSCVKGNTTLNNQDNWGVYDLLLYLEELMEWYQFEGVTNKIEEAQPVVGDEVPLFEETTGPFFTAYKWDAVGNATTVNTSGGTTTVGTTFVVENTTLNVPGVVPGYPYGATTVSQSIGPEVLTKTVTGVNGVNVSINATTMRIDAPIYGDYETGTSNITAINLINAVLSPTNEIRVTWIRVGRVWRICMVGRSPFISYTIATSNQMQMTFNLSSATDPVLSSARHNGRFYTGGVIVGGTLTDSPLFYLPAGGTCIGAPNPDAIVCYMTRVQTDQDPSYYFNMQFYFYELQP